MGRLLCNDATIYNACAKSVRFLARVTRCVRFYSASEQVRVVNPRRACAARVTVLGLCVCMCVCVCVCVSALFSHFAQLRGKQEIRATSASHGQQNQKGVLFKNVLLES